VQDEFEIQADAIKAGQTVIVVESVYTLSRALYSTRRGFELILFSFSLSTPESHPFSHFFCTAKSFFLLAARTLDSSSQSLRVFTPQSLGHGPSHFNCSFAPFLPLFVSTPSRPIATSSQPEDQLPPLVSSSRNVEERPWSTCSSSDLGS
jgi:hypothetical protein